MCLKHIRAKLHNIGFDNDFLDGHQGHREQLKIRQIRIH